MLKTEFPTTSDIQLTLEQPAELTRHLRRPRPITWEDRKQIYNFMVSLGLLAALWTVEICLLVRFDGIIHSWSFCLQAALMTFAPYLLLAEILLRLQPSGPRSLSFRKRGLHIQSPKRFLIRWKAIRRLSFEPVTDDPEIIKLSIYHGPGGRPFYHRCWSIIIPSKKEAVELAQKFEHRKDSGQLGECEIAHHNAPQPKTPRKPMPNGFYLVFGLFFLINGLPLFLAGVSQQNWVQTNMEQLEYRLQQQRLEKAEPMTPVPAQPRKMTLPDFLLQLFPTTSVRQTITIVGAMFLFLSTLGIAAMFWSNGRLERQWMLSQAKPPLATGV